MDDLPGWVQKGTDTVGRHYREYLKGRQAGGARRFFGSKAHALYFLNAVAPTKLVDGAWLHGVLQRWGDGRFSHLVRTYLEELGEGQPDKNHVVLYRKLLAAHGCEHWQRLDDEHFVQGAVQLALAHQAADYLPEVIGFNLGYEQLPLHLLITAYELNELGIDPYYFTLHVTVDNAATGHAQKALQSVFDALPQASDRAAFYRRVISGYKLNLLGVDTMTAIRSFDLEKALLSALASKAAVGAQVHSDYCRIGGRTVSSWLSEPGQMPGFLAALEGAGWIKRHQDPENSRFWKLIHGERSEMFGVFTGYEQQLLHDWIAGDLLQDAGARKPLDGKPRQASFNARRHLDRNWHQTPAASRPTTGVRGIFRTHAPHHRAANEQNDFNDDLRVLEDRLSQMVSRDKVMAELIDLMSPANHHTPAGLMATRIFTRLMNA